MKMILSTNNKVIFDLDDTLYSERDFETSGIEYVCNFFEIEKIELESILNNRKNWIEKIVNLTNNQVTFDKVLSIYRNHIPKIQLYDDSKSFLNKLAALEIEISLITDGRSVTQRNKLKALGIESYFKHIIISEEINSEKPSEVNYSLVMNDKGSSYVYIADNPTKDFLSPNKFGWKTICRIDRGQNIHKQNFNLPTHYLPQHKILSFEEITLLNEN